MQRLLLLRTLYHGSAKLGEGIDAEIVRGDDSRPHYKNHLTSGACSSRKLSSKFYNRPLTQKIHEIAFNKIASTPQTKNNLLKDLLREIMKNKSGKRTFFQCDIYFRRRIFYISI